MNKVLIICGPTATGKTKLGIHLAQWFDGEIISADSRQVYKGMDIGTGKGIPAHFQFSIFNFPNGKKLGHYSDSKTKIWGYDLVEPNTDFSIAQYRQLMWPVVENIWSRNKLPIVVGGTGFYIEALVNPPETIGVSENKELRHELNQLSVLELQQRLEKLDLSKYNSMNNSDRHNPRRLIRAIEVVSDKKQVTSNKENHTLRTKVDTLWIGLTASKKFLRQRVVESINSRASDTFTQEINQLESNHFDWSSPAASATGYNEWKAHLDGQNSKNEVIEQWITREHQYQKRQLTWFNKNKNIHWFNIEQNNLKPLVEAKVKAW